MFEFGPVKWAVAFVGIEKNGGGILLKEGKKIERPSPGDNMAGGEEARIFSRTFGGCD